MFTHPKMASRQETDIILPCDLDAERMILASAILDGEKIAILRDVMFTEDFSTQQHQTIWRTMTKMHDQGMSIDRVTVISSMMEAKTLEAAGGMDYMARIDEGMPLLSNLNSWIEIVRKKSVKRQAIIKCDQVMKRLALAGEDASEIFMEASAKMAEFNGDLVGDVGFSTPLDVIRRAGGIDKYLDYTRGTGIPSPWESLNRLTGGFREEELIIVAAHTGRGKTAFALNIAHTAASVYQVPVAVFSMEMGDQLITDRLIAINGQIDGRSLRRPERNPDIEAARFEQVGGSIRYTATLPIYICDSVACTVPAMEGRLRRLMAQVPIGMVIVDYIQLAKSVEQYSSRAEEVGQITRALKRMTKSLKIPIIALSQFNRDSAKNNREPEIYDLKESGSIEQDASLIILLHFETMYDVAAGIETANVKLKVPKQRNGPEGWLPFQFHAPSGVFSERKTY